MNENNQGEKEILGKDSLPQEEQDEQVQNLRVLEGTKAIAYSAGILGQFLPSTLINAFLSIFWIYVVGLDAFLVGIATALSAVANALFSPIFGYLSDKKEPGKFGKRKPFILGGLPLLVLSLIFLWITPYLCEEFGQRDFGLFAYLAILNVTFYINFACIRSPYLAMLTEQSEDEKNRIKIAGQQGLFSILASVLGILLPMILMSRLAEPEEIFNTPQDKQFLLEILPILGIIFGVISALFTLGIVFAINEDFLRSKKSDKPKIEEKVGVKEVLKKLFVPFKDPEYRKWLFSSYSMNTAMRMMVKSLTPYFTFVLLLKGDPYIYYLLAAVPFAVAGFMYWQKSAKKKGLKETFLKSTTLIAASLAGTLIILIPMATLIKQIVAFVFIAGAISNLVGGFILPNPIISELSDQMPEELREEDGKKSAGAYFGSYLFMLNIANATGDIVLGAIMTGDNARNPLIIGLLLRSARFST